MAYNPNDFISVILSGFDARIAAKETAVTVPAAPSLSATPGNAQVSLAWTDGATGGATITAHKLYAGTSAGSLALVGTITSASPYVDTGLTNGTTRYYALTALNSAGESPRSSVVSATPVVPGSTANYVATDNATWESALSSATAGQIVEIQANIPAPSTAKRLSVAPGVTIRPKAGFTYTVGTSAQTAGYSYNVDATAGQTAPTIIAAGVTYYIGNSYSASVPATDVRGGWRFVCGKGQFNASVIGIRGGGAGQSKDDNLVFQDSASFPVQFDCYAPTVQNSGGDLITTIGYGGTNTSVDQHNAASLVNIYDATVNTPGPQGIDNLATAHAGLPLRIFGGVWSGGRNGPMFRCNPVTTPLEIYGAVIDITGSTLDAAQNGDQISATKFVGNSVIGTNSATNYRILICPDGNNPTQRSCAIGNTSVLPVYNTGPHPLAPVIYRNTMAPYPALNAVTDAVVGFGDTASAGNVAPTLGALAAYNKISVNTATVRNVAFKPAITWPVASNFEIVPTTTNVSDTAIAPIGGSTVCHSWQWTGSGFTKWAFRGDLGGSASSIVDCATRLRVADGALLLPAGGGTATNCTTDGSVPSGASVGLGGKGPQLQSGTGLSMFNVVEAYLSANAGRTPGITGAYYTSVSTPMASIS